MTARLGYPKSRRDFMATLPVSTSTSLVLADPLPLDSGQRLERVTVAYETYGELAADKSNAILVHHALTGDQHLASPHPITGKPGWRDPSSPCSRRSRWRR